MISVPLSGVLELASSTQKVSLLYGKGWKVEKKFWMS